MWKYFEFPDIKWLVLWAFIGMAFTLGTAIRLVVWLLSHLEWV